MQNIRFTTIVAFSLALLTLSSVHAKTLTPLEREEQIQDMNQLSNTIDNARILLENFRLKTEGQCAKAIGKVDVCKCLSMKLPTSVDFVGYVTILAQNKEDLNYDQLSADDKKLVEIVRTARNECVK